MKNIRKRLLASVVAMTLACSMLPMTAFAADEEAAAEEPVVVEATTPEPAEPTAVISNEDLPAAVVSEPAEAPADETVTEEPAEETETEETDEEPTEAPAEEAVEDETEAPTVDATAEEPTETVPEEEPKEEEPETTEPLLKDWEVSKSKTATELDENFETEVTLSLPAADEQLVSDVVLVLDKSTSADIEDQALAMLQALKSQIEGNNAKINVGIVIFNKEAHASEYMDLATQYDKIVAAIKQEIKSGTNSHAGLLSGIDMLEKSDTLDSRKYLVFVSDGITYMYDGDGDPTTSDPTSIGSQNADSKPEEDRKGIFAGPDGWNIKYGTEAPDTSKYVPEDWAEYLNTIGEQILADGDTYEALYDDKDAISAKGILHSESANHAMGVDKALYLTYQAYMQAAAKYHCYAVLNPSESGEKYYPFGPSYMAYLANQTAGGDDAVKAFEAIQNDIYYLLGAGSEVEDVIGYVDGEDGYNFDLIEDASKLVIKIGRDDDPDAEKLVATQIGEHEYGFGAYEELNNDGSVVIKYRYVIKYTPADDGTEKLIWQIFEPVSQFKPVSLTYALKLVNPQTEAGTYGKYDKDGSQGYDGLFTNNSATLYPVDSFGNKGEAETFGKPTVEYTVKAAEPEPTPTPEPEPEPEPQPDPDEPEEPVEPEDPTEPEQPVEPEEPAEETEETEETTESGLPQTGQDWAVVAVIAIAGAAALTFGLKRRKTTNE